MSCYTVSENDKWKQKTEILYSRAFKPSLHKHTQTRKTTTTTTKSVTGLEMRSQEIERCKPYCLIL